MLLALRVHVRESSESWRNCIPVATVVGMIAEGMTPDAILRTYPDLEQADVREALAYAAEAVRERELPLVTVT